MQPPSVSWLRDIMNYPPKRHASPIHYLILPNNLIDLIAQINFTALARQLRKVPPLAMKPALR